MSEDRNLALEPITTQQQTEFLTDAQDVEGPPDTFVRKSEQYAVLAHWLGSCFPNKPKEFDSLVPLHIPVSFNGRTRSLHLPDGGSIPSIGTNLKVCSRAGYTSSLPGFDASNSDGAKIAKTIA